MVYCCEPAVVADVADVAAASVTVADDASESDCDPRATLEAIAAVNALLIVCAGSAFPSASRTVTRTVAFSPGPYVALSNENFAVVATPVDTRTAAVEAEVAVAAATVEASITLNLAVPLAVPATGHAWNLYVES